MKKKFNKPFDFSDLKCFVCLCYISTITSNRKKLDPRVVACVFLGFKPNTKGYLTFNLQTRAIETSRNIIFYEDDFPYLHIDNNTAPDTKNPPQIIPSPDPLYDVPHDDPTDPTFTIDIQPPQPISYVVPLRSERPRQRPARYNDFHTNFTSIVASLPSSICYPLSSILSYHKLSPAHRNFIMSISSISEPKSYVEASKQDCWLKAMRDEITTLELNKTWTIIDLPPHKTAIGCRWIYKIKHKADDNIERYKAR